LARFLDRPFFPWKNVLAGFSLGQFILEGILSFRQYRVLQQKKPPKVLKGEVSQKVFDESQVGWHWQITLRKLGNFRPLLI
jgi:STE24 endopeptidase